MIGFNLFGWIWRKTRRLHLIFAGVTLASWFILGIWYGMGYCPITEWQWNLKEQLGETNLPASFVEYHFEKISGRDVSSGFVDAITLGSFLVAIAFSLYFNFRKKKI